jgi:hypothetical protein
MGYGDGVVNEAEKREDLFLSRGSWT